MQLAPLLIPEVVECQTEGEKQLQIERVPTTPKKKLRYPGDVCDTIAHMTPKTAMQSIKILKGACKKKAKTIKRLRDKVRNQKRTIENFSAVIDELRKKCLLSCDSCHVLQVL